MFSPGILALRFLLYNVLKDPNKLQAPPKTLYPYHLNFPLKWWGGVKRALKFSFCSKYLKIISFEVILMQKWIPDKIPLKMTPNVTHFTQERDEEAQK